MGEKRAHVPAVGMETHKVKFNRALYLDGAESVDKFRIGKPDLTEVHGKQT